VKIWYSSGYSIGAVAMPQNDTAA